MALTITSIVIAINDRKKYRRHSKRERTPRPAVEQYDNLSVVWSAHKRKHPSNEETERFETKYIRDPFDQFEDGPYEDGHGRKYRDIASEYMPWYDEIEEDERTHGFRVISEREFDEQKPMFEKISLTYYIVDDVLVDDQEEIVTDTAFVLGIDLMDVWWKEQGDPDQAYVRNYEMSTDYEISRVRSSYLQIQSLDD